VGGERTKKNIFVERVLLMC